MGRDDLGGGVREKRAPLLEAALFVALPRTRGVEDVGHKNRAPLALGAAQGENARFLRGCHQSGILLGTEIRYEFFQGRDVAQQEDPARAFEQALACEARQLARHLLARSAHPARDLVMRRHTLDTRRVRLHAGEPREEILAKLSRSASPAPVPPFALTAMEAAARNTESVTSQPVESIEAGVLRSIGGLADKISR